MMIAPRGARARENLLARARRIRNRGSINPWFAAHVSPSRRIGGRGGWGAGRRRPYCRFPSAVSGRLPPPVSCLGPRRGTGLAKAASPQGACFRGKTRCLPATALNSKEMFCDPATAPRLLRAPGSRRKVRAWKGRRAEGKWGGAVEVRVVACPMKGVWPCVLWGTTCIVPVVPT